MRKEVPKMNRNEISKLVIKAQQGDNEAFERLYTEFKDKVYFFAYRNVGNKTAAEDITSETFVTALEKLSQLKSGESFVGWLYTICYNKCVPSTPTLKFLYYRLVSNIGFCNHFLECSLYTGLD